jgi:universal stress protein A
MQGVGWKRLCCCVDFSEESRNALRVAVDLCRRFGAELTLLHVEDRREPPASVTSPLLREWQEEAERSGVRVSAAHEHGDPKDRIVQYAHDQHVDLVVLGTRGSTGRDRVLAGSVAENVVRRARCPVLTVHAEWSPAPA